MVISNKNSSRYRYIELQGAQKCPRSWLSHAATERAANILSENCNKPLEELDDLFSQLSEFPGAIRDGTAATDIIDYHVATTGELTDEDIIAGLARISPATVLMSSNLPTCSDALHALSIICCHCASIEGCALSFSESLGNVEKCMLNNALKMKRQKIGDYFS